MNTYHILTTSETLMLKSESRSSVQVVIQISRSLRIKTTSQSIKKREERMTGTQFGCGKPALSYSSDNLITKHERPN
ncbi:hypothetical protein I7I48_01852 [Histoplasma ohiense]|nr:hypothetical protein I7I48_01852 [Histoplasma ohiense (nom. inval.)]